MESSGKSVALTTVVAILGVIAAGGAATLLIVSMTDLRDDGASRASAQTGLPPVVEDLYVAAAPGEIVRVTAFVSANDVGDPAAWDAIELHYSPPASPTTTRSILDTNLTVIRDKDGSLAATPAVLGPGDLVEVTWSLNVTGPFFGHDEFTLALSAAGRIGPEYRFIAPPDAADGGMRAWASRL